MIGKKVTKMIYNKPNQSYLITKRKKIRNSKTYKSFLEENMRIEIKCLIFLMVGMENPRDILITKI
jgi:hypothetical protein